MSIRRIEIQLFNNFLIAALTNIDQQGNPDNKQAFTQSTYSLLIDGLNSTVWVEMFG